MNRRKIWTDMADYLLSSRAEHLPVVPALTLALSRLGLLLIGTGPGKGYALRPSPPCERSSEARSLSSPEILYRLERWCGEPKADMVLTYKLSPKPVCGSPWKRGTDRQKS